VRGVHRILVLRPNHRLGNTLLLTPLLAELERAYPSAEIDIVSAGPAAAEVFGRFDAVRRLAVLPAKAVRHPLTLWKTLRELRTRRYDLAIDPCVGSQSARLLLGMARATHKLGFAGADRPGGLTCGVPVPEQPRHMAQLPVYLLRAARGEPFQAERCPTLDIRLGRTELAKGRERVRRVLGAQAGGGGLLIGLFGAATGAKTFPRDWWMPLLAELEKTWPGTRFVEIVPVGGTSSFGEAFPAYYSTSIRRMAAVMAATDLVISADCGVMHLAVASQVDTAGLFSITRSSQYAPYGVGNFAIAADGRAPEDVAGELVRRWRGAAAVLPARDAGLLAVGA
jgi:ADP-heptose:LPS heptosyltransferase